MCVVLCIESAKNYNKLFMGKKYIAPEEHCTTPAIAEKQISLIFTTQFYTRKEVPTD